MTTSTSTPPRSAVPTHVSPLVASLRRARRAWWTVASTRAVVVAGGVAAAVLPLAWVRAWSQGRAGPLLDAFEAWWPSVAAAFGVALVLAVVTIVRRTPTLLELARRADRVLEQEHRLSTSFEVRSRGVSASLVARALIDDAERRVPSLDWTMVVRTPWPRWVVPTLAAMFVLAVLAAALPVPARPRLESAGTPTPMTADRAARDAEAVRRFAEALEGVAATEDSPYLQAVASSFADLAERLAAGTIDADAAALALAELVVHLEVAAEDVGAEFAAAVRSALSPAGSESGTDVSDGLAEDGGAGDEASGGTPDARLDASGIDADASIYMAMEDFANEVGRNPGGIGLRASRPAPQDLDADGAFYGGVMRAERDPNAVEAEPSGLRAEAPGGGDVVGAAEQSSERAGDAAGDGGADLAGGADGFLDLDADSAPAAALPANQRDDGRFVGVELVPDEELGGARDGGPSDGSGVPFRRADEAASTARPIGSTYREVVGRYFMPGAVAAEAAP